MRIKTIDEIYKNLDRYVFIDVRSPAEFDEDSIPGAINLPLLDNEERKIVGTAYKQVSHYDAKLIGMDIVGKKLGNLYEQMTKISLENKGRSLCIYCARGGLRSNTVASLFDSIGINLVKLEGGYKNYREYVRNTLEDVMSEVELITIYGRTGTGKTLMLDEFKSRGVEVLDLERCANHRGSLLGSVGLKAQYGQKKFETLIFDTIIKRKSDVLFCEGESKRIGKVLVPECVFDKMESGRQAYIESSVDRRVDVIYDDYINDLFEPKDVEEAIEKMSKYTSKEKTKEFLSYLEQKDYRQLIESLMVQYYDLNYNSEKRKDLPTFVLDNGISSVCDELIQYFGVEKGSNE